MPDADHAQPFADLRVVDLSLGVSGGYASKLLADHGADVVKVEPPGGDPIRRHVVVAGDPVDIESAPLHLHLGTNKRSVVADLDSPDEQRFVADLAAAANLVIESFPPGWLDARGLGYEALRARRANPVLLSITPFGADGPFASFAGEDIVTYAMGGPMYSTGIAEREPLKLAGQLTSYQVGTIGAVAALGAIEVAERDGRPVHVDLSALEAQTATLDRRATLLIYYAFTRVDVDRVAQGTVGVVPRGAFPCADGFVHVSGNPMWRDRMADVLDDAELRTRLLAPGWLADEGLADLLTGVLYGWLAERTRAEATEAAQARRWPITPLHTPLELLTDPHFVARDFFVEVDHPVAGRVTQPGAPFRMDNGWQLRRPAPLLDQHGAEVRAEVGDSAGRSPASATPGRGGPAAGGLPLEGVRVLDLTVVWAGPFATMLLADLGAEVIRFDNPWIFPASSRGQMPRPPLWLTPQLGPLGGCYPDFVPGERPWNQHGIYAAQARNKRSATLDLRTDAGREAFLGLVERADLLVENNRRDLLDDLGLGWDVLHARNPALVALRMPSMGLDGPYRDYTGFGVNFEALCALSPLRGYPDLDHSTLSLVYHMDAASGAAGAFAAMSALRRRRRTGVGELVELAQSENMVQHIGEYLVDAGRTGRHHQPIGNRHPTRAPQGCYRCRGEDAWVVLSVGTEPEWTALCEAMERPDLTGDSRFAGPAARIANHDALDREIEAWTAALAPWEVFRRCQLAGVPAAPVLDETGCFANPQLLARGFFRPQGSPDIGTYPFPGHAWRWDGPPLRWEPIARKGRDNEYVFREV
ncbi:MAG: CoA transferase, partial [Acidimicrobiia bacterium]|nr:CoA transferase [Acidimicrobiia bacterium]